MARGQCNWNDPLSRGEAQQSTGLREEISLAARRFNAWWEGYAFNADDERRRIRLDLGLTREEGLKNIDAMAMALWGAGRLDPGDPAWTLRHARALSLPLKAEIAVLGAGAGAPLSDLRTATRWKLRGYSRFPEQRKRSPLQSYEAASMRLERGVVDGGLCFFELHRERDPVSLSVFAGEISKAGAPFSFVDFAAARRGMRLDSCFRSPLSGSLQTTDQLIKIIEAGGFRVSETVDETRSFIPLIATGWSRWRDAYQLGSQDSDPLARAAFLRTLGQLAHIWAERFDALRAGHLRVVRIQARRIS